MNALVIGAGGQLGRAVMKHWDEDTTASPVGVKCNFVRGVDQGGVEVRGHKADMLGPTIDVTDIVSVRRAIGSGADVVFNCAAMTDVDGCEREPDKAYAVNWRGAGNVAAVCRERGAFLVHVSTDYVFSGCLNDMVSEGYYEWDDPSPVNEYGRSKLLGERAVAEQCPAHAIVRTGWLYSAGGMAGGRPTFVNRIVELLGSGKMEPLAVVDDQHGDPTDVASLARVMCEIGWGELPGIFHATCEGGPVSRYDQAVAIRDILKLRRPIDRCGTSDLLKADAVRPACTSLANKALALYGIGPMPNWRKSLKAVLKGG